MTSSLTETDIFFFVPRLRHVDDYIFHIPLVCASNVYFEFTDNFQLGAWQWPRAILGYVPDNGVVIFDLLIKNGQVSVLETFPGMGYNM